MSANVTLNLKIPEVIKEVDGVVNKGMSNFVQAIVNNAKRDHTFKNQTGVNEKSITGKGDEEEFEVFTTSGYGGYVELKMPYLYPAMEKARRHLDKYIGEV